MDPCTDSRGVPDTSRRGSRLPLFIIAAGAIAAAFGLLALLGWALGSPRLTSFGSGLIPMAPSTAVLLLLSGASIGLRARTPLSRRNFLICAAAGCLVGTIALLLLVLSSLRIRSTIEHLGMNVAGTVANAPTGHMSQVTSLFFLLTSVSFLASLSPLALRRWRFVLASGAAGVLLGTCSIFLLAYLYGEPLLYGGTFIPPAINTVLSFTALGIALLALTVRSSRPHGGASRELPRASSVFLLIFVLLAAGIVSVGWLSFRHSEKNFRVEAEQRLAAIALLKANELAQWRESRRADGAIFFENPSFSAMVRRFFGKPGDPDAQRQLQDWLGKFPALHDYDQVRLMDVQGVTRLSVPGGVIPASADTLRVAAEALRSRQIVFRDLYRHDRDHRAYLQVMVPILDESAAGRPLGVVGLRIDPATYLYPFLESWPSPSASAETLLLRREGSSIRYLNDLRRRSNASLALSIPPESTGIPAIRAGQVQTGVMRGEDYGGVPVIAATRAVPGSPWFLVAKMDVAEVSAPTRERLWQVVAMIGVLLFGAGTGVGLVWRQQRTRFLLEKARFVEALQVEKANLDAIFESSPLALFVLDEATDIVRVNKAALALTGSRAEDVLHRRQGSALRCVHRSKDPRGCGYSTECSLCPVRNGIEALIASGVAMHAAEVVLELDRGGGPQKVWMRVGAEPVLIDGRRHWCVAMEDITAHKQANEALARSEERYRKAQAMGHLGHWEFDPTSRIFSGSAEAMRMYGFPERPQVPFEDIVSCVSKTDAERVVQALFSLIQNGTEFDEEFEIRPVDSREIRVLWSVARMTSDEHGNPTLVSGILQDITERKRAERVLRESEERFATLFRAIPVAVAVTRLDDNNLADVNEAWQALTGYAREDVVGHPATAFNLWVDPAHRARALQMLRERGTTRLESQIRTKAGELREVLMSGEIVEVAGERYLLGIAQDITERKKTELQLRYQSDLLANVSEAIIATDREFNITYWNAAAERTYGWAAKEVLGKHFLTFIQTRFPGESRRAVMRKTAATGFWQGELLHNRRDGTVFPVQVTISVVKDADNRVIGHVALNRDITAYLRGEEEKARLQDQLRQSQKVEAIGSLAGGVAHDFNNLTAIILGYGEMLLSKLRPEDPSHHLVEQIVAAGRRATALTRQLLAFSRRQTLLPEVLDLNALLRNFEKMLARIIGEDVELVFKLAADPGRIKADPGQIEQVVTNLAVNARDAMPRGGKLTIETSDIEFAGESALDRVRVVHGKYVMFSLADTGCGMDEATMARIFEPFFTTKPKGKGTGLGLATVYGIVKQSNGYIWAESEPGRGTTFKICLPRTDEEPAAKQNGAGAETPRGSGERILLVEDEAPLRELCSTILERLGYRVSCAAHGAEALMLIREQGLAPDLVVTDVIMPGMSGAELAEQLLRDRPGLGVLYMSGYPDETIAPHGVLNPGTLLIQKPFTEFELATQVWKALERKAAEKPREGATTAREDRRVLMIDDDSNYRELVRHFCTRRGYIFAGVDSATAALAALAGSAFDVLLVDLNIPGTSGEEILRAIRAAGYAASAIVLTGDVVSADMKMLRPLGVVCALEKSSDAEPLLQAIEAAGAPISCRGWPPGPPPASLSA